MNKIEECLDLLKTIVHEIDCVEESNVISLTMKDYFNRLLIESKGAKRREDTWGERTAHNAHTGKNFVSHQIKSKYNEEEDFNIDVEPLTMSNEEEENLTKEENEDEDKEKEIEKEEEIVKKSNSYVPENTKFLSRTYRFDDKEERFEFIKPTSINDSELKNAFDLHGINIKNCLIVKNKDSFLNHLTNIKEILNKVLFEIDPKRQTDRRRGISVDINKGLLSKEMFLNTQNPGESEKGLIHFGNKNVEMVLSMMIGIRNSVTSLGEHSKLFDFDEDDDAFKDVNLFEFSQKSFEKEVNCKFYDYSPKVFYNIRKLYGISNEEYDKSLGPENFLGNLILPKNRSLKELVSAGKSGSFFYFSYDSKFVLKTIPAHEFEFFKSIIKDYYFHIYNNPQTLLQRYLALHTMIFNGLPMHFVIMNNVFNTGLKVHLKYDLKGSTYQRQSIDINKEKNYDKFNFNIPMKDLDYKYRKEKIYLLKDEKEMLMKELENDSKFLRSKSINDYSFLIGIHDPDMDNGSIEMIKEQILEKSTRRDSTINTRNLTRHVISEFNEVDFVARKPFFEKHKGGIQASDGKKVYFFGIIDLFTFYGAKKKMEHFFKTIGQGTGISCQPPDDYSDRFIREMKSIFEAS